MEFKTNKNKFEVFLEVAKEIKTQLKITPILYGSLGLYRLIGEKGEANDVDILIPWKNLDEGWEETLAMMEKLGFKLEDAKERAFKRGREMVAFAKEEDLLDMVGIDPKSLSVTELEGVAFRELTPEQYLQVYKKMLRDQYRQEKKQKDDSRKIELLEKFLDKKIRTESVESTGAEEVDRTLEYLGGWKRCQADFENYKRMQGEAQKELMGLATENLVLQLLPILDNFHASTAHVPPDQKDNAWVTGIMHIQRQLETFLKDNGVEEIETKEGDAFDPAVHEAISQEAGAEFQEAKHKVAKVVSKGYRINGKVIRAARVTVA